MAEAKRRAGRPRKKRDDEISTEYVGFRAPKDLKAQLEEGCRISGRSLSTEAQIRLQNSFHEERTFGGPRLAPIFQFLAATAAFLSDGAEWLGEHGDYGTFNAVRDALLHDFALYLDRLKPPEPEETTRRIADLKFRIATLPPDQAMFWCRALWFDKSLPPEVRQEFHETLKNLEANHPAKQDEK